MNKEDFYHNLKQRFPDNEFILLEFNGASKPIKYKCLKLNLKFNQYENI